MTGAAAFDDAVVVWTVRVSLGLLTAGFVARRLRFDRLARGCWAAGAAAMWAHLAAAFSVAHDWSHADAVRETARQTQALTGIDWGGGVWINYLFAAVWTTDAAWWLLRPDRHAARPRWLDVTVGAFLGFIAVNGAIVFENGPTRWVGVACCAAIAAAGCVSPANAPSPPG
ncbi:hypothetical protein [Alienimonas californiensis]|uniref:Uncharacterized protein n=1 Tax=Alienimonas californiensis TaxID=2527989 RepID=A0A517PAA3_9PLAN|nr:hypothetical protein [Alienimonas californiensis]QDT16299.1 hypothetical protein CA12_24000 [Alienimonas californiensis]